jgi:hypothetical protein
MKPRFPLLLLSLLAVGASGADTKAPATAASAPATPPAPVTTTPAATPPAATPTAAPAGRPNGSGRPNARAGSTSAAPTDAFQNFSMIMERNIFNANRSPYTRGGPDRPAAPRTDEITLVGTMDSEKGLRAFFDGSNSSYRKALHVGDSVDKFKVTKIEPKKVELESGGKTISVNVGQHLSRPEGGDWILSASDLPSQARAGTMGTMGNPSRPDPSAAPEIPANADEITRRLMERRARTLKN